MIPVLHGVWAAAGGLVGDYEHIETQTVGAGGAASVTFNSIPGTYKHLEIRAITRQTSNSAASDLTMRFNADSGSNYAWHQIYGSGSAATSSANVSTTSTGWNYSPDTSILANSFAAAVVQILDYTSTSKNKTMRSLWGYDANGSGFVGLRSGLWFATPAAITSITLGIVVATNFAQYSTFSLYGVK